MAFSRQHESEEVSVVATSGRTRGRQSARSGALGPAGEHRSKIMTVLATGVVVIVLVLSLTSEGHVIDAATQHFMLYYAGVFALIGLTASVGIGLVATDRIFMKPGHRVMAQSVHRAVSFGTLAFLIIHIVTEILAQRSHVLDGFVPFLSPYRTFYIGLGTIASDLIVLLVVTSIIRKRFTAHGKAWRWRAIHYSSYVAFVFGVLHGLLGGRPGKPYVDWSYGFAIALTALAVAIRFLATSLRPKESLSTSPAVAQSGPGAGSSPLRAASLTMAQAQLGGTVQMLPAGAAVGAGATARPAGMSLSGASVPTATMQLPAGSGYGAYGDGGFTPLGAPPYGDEPYRDRPYGDVPFGEGPYRDAMTTHPYQPSALASLPAPPRETRQPLYEPGYVGPPRYEGAPRNGTGPMPRAATGPMPRIDAGPMSRADSAPISRAGSAAMPRQGTGPMPSMTTGPAPSTGTGPTPNMLPGPIPAAGTGPVPRADAGQLPRGGTGPMPRAGTGPVPQAATAAMPQGPSGPKPPGSPPRAATGPMPQAATGPMPRAGTGAMPRTATGPMPRAATGPIPRLDPPPPPPPRRGSGPMTQSPSGPAPRHGRAPANEPRRRRSAADEPRSQRGGGTWR